MSKAIAASANRSVRLLGMAVLLGFLAACTTTDTAPENPHLDGEWHLDAAASDNADRKIAAAISGAESKLRQRLVNAGFSQYGPGGGEGHGAHGAHSGHGGGAGGPPGQASGDSSNGAGDSTELNGDEYSQTGYIGPDFAGLERQLKLLLDSPRSLTIAVLPDSVRIATDNTPAQDYAAGDQFTRIDEYGTARIDTRWSGTTLELRARYSNHAEVLTHYTADPRTQTLSVTCDLNDPVAGKLRVHSVYRK